MDGRYIKPVGVSLDGYIVYEEECNGRNYVSEVLAYSSLGIGYNLKFPIWVHTSQRLFVSVVYFNRLSPLKTTCGNQIRYEYVYSSAKIITIPEMIGSFAMFLQEAMSLEHVLADDASELAIWKNNWTIFEIFFFCFFFFFNCFEGEQLRNLWWEHLIRDPDGCPCYVRLVPSWLLMELLNWWPSLPLMTCWPSAVPYDYCPLRPNSFPPLVFVQFDDVDDGTDVEQLAAVVVCTTPSTSHCLRLL